MEVFSLAGDRQEQLKLLQLLGFQKRDAVRTLQVLEDCGSRNRQKEGKHQ